MEQKSSEFSKLRVYPHWVSASADNAGLWWRLGVGLGPICKRHHRPALAADADTAADADAWCGLGLRESNKSLKHELGSI